MSNDRSIGRRATSLSRLIAPVVSGVSVLGDAAPRLAWIAVLLAAVTAILDRFVVLRLAGAVRGSGDAWKLESAEIGLAIVGIVLCGRWARMVGLDLAEIASDSALIAGTRSLIAADWREATADGPGKVLAETVSEMRDAAARSVTALPAFFILLFSMGWLGLTEPGAPLIVAIIVLLGIALVRRQMPELQASEMVLTHAEATFGRLVSRLLNAGASVRMATAGLPDFLERTIWPSIDDATRAEGMNARLTARVVSLIGWLSLLLVIALLAFLPSDAPDSSWARMIIVVAATLYPARRAVAALPFVRRVGEASVRIGALAEQFAPADTQVVTAPPRWRTITLQQLQLTAHDSPAASFAAVGPLDIALHSGEIVVFSGPNPDDRWTLLHLLSGLINPDGGAILLDGRVVPPAMLRGLCGGVFDPDMPLPGMPGDISRAAALASRFELPVPEAGAPYWPPADDGADRERVRLAIVAAELEDRPIRLYDEQAIRMDPRFRPVFAATLQEARARGRLCVVATNDPVLIAVADRVVRLEDGLLVDLSGSAQ